jgi:DNA-binding NarL/FixJ family response regulator
LIRAGVRAFVSAEPDYVYVGEAARGPEAIEKTLVLGPDVLLIELSLPELPAVDVLRALRDNRSPTRSIVLAPRISAEALQAACDAGAHGCLLQDCEAGEFREAIRAVAGGDVYFAPELAQLVLREYARASRPARPTRLLTSREARVLSLLAREKSSRQIAALLGLSPRTVEKHRANMMKKLDIHTAAGLVRYAIRVGLVAAE